MYSPDSPPTAKIRQRLLDHCCNLCKKDENLTKSHGRYLESRLITLTTSAGRATVVNGTSPCGNPLPEADVSDMEFFLEQVQVVFPVLGLTFLQPVPTATEQRLVFENTDSRCLGLNRTAVVVFRQARKNGSHLGQHKDLRDELVQTGKLQPSTNPEYFEFAEDVPSHPAQPQQSLRLQCSGPANWRVEGTGQTYGDWQLARLQAAGVDTTSEE